ncbi:hypothetical protein [Fournierella massiliensis]|uniref:hypothetical protein n=1 Tax=Allofournierella massiliensis TaxID=1650663 RepID=UPI003522B703
MTKKHHFVAAATKRCFYSPYNKVYFNKGNTAQFTADASSGGSRQNFPCYFPKMLTNPPKDWLRFLVHITKNFPACSTTRNYAALPKKCKATVGRGAHGKSYQQGGQPAR